MCFWVIELGGCVIKADCGWKAEMWFHPCV